MTNEVRRKIRNGLSWDLHREWARVGNRKFTLMELVDAKRFPRKLKKLIKKEMEK